MAAWCLCNSDQINSPFVRMEEEVNYEYQLGTMVGRYCRLL